MQWYVRVVVVDWLIIYQCELITMVQCCLPMHRFSASLLHVFDLNITMHYQVKSSLIINFAAKMAE